MENNIVILGGGESGVGAAILAKKLGISCFLSDFSAIKPNFKAELIQFGIEFEESMHTEERILSAGLVIKSPGIPDKAPIIKKIKEKNIPIISEIEFGGRYTDAKMICITGSNGKTTTTLWIYHILKNSGAKVGLAGNVGTSLARQVATSNFDLFVVELSSFQLDDMFEFRADIAVLMNITPDHLDRYDYKLENYVASKFRILQNMRPEDLFIYCADDPIINEYLESHNYNVTFLPFSIENSMKKAAYLADEKVVLNVNNNLTMEFDIDKIALPGKHNIYNSMAAGLSAMAVNIRKESIRESLQDFQGVEHRLEKVATVRDVEFINDSKATNVNSTWYALESMRKKVIWIVGGVDKGNDYIPLNRLVVQKVSAIICLGVDNQKIVDHFNPIVNTIVEAGSMNEAVEKAYKLANRGDVVLLSPCCASFDLFTNYEDRGKQFKQCVRNL